MCASCLPSIALPQSLSVFALIAVSLWSARTIIRIGDWYVYGGAFMLDLIRSRIYLGDECLSACPPCDFGFMMRLWNLLPCTSAAEPMRLIARGAITSSILLVKIIVQLCVFFCGRACVCVYGPFQMALGIDFFLSNAATKPTLPTGCCHVYSCVCLLKWCLCCICTYVCASREIGNVKIWTEVSTGCKIFPRSWILLIKCLSCNSDK